MSWAAVHNNWKLVANNDMSNIELFDISSDVLETTNLVADKPEVVDSLLGLLEMWRTSLPIHPVGDVFSAERNR